MADKKCYSLEQPNHMLVRESCHNASLTDVLTDKFKGEKAWILYWEMHKVDFAWFDGEKVHWPNGAEAQYFLEARIFNESKECHIRCIDGKYYGRILMEYESDMEHVSDDKNILVYKKALKPYMWGSIVEDKKTEDGVVIDRFVREDRGMQYHLPCKKEATGFRYKVEQYYIPNQEDGMLKMLDYRMVELYQEIPESDEENRGNKEPQLEVIPIGGVDSNE